MAKKQVKQKSIEETLWQACDKYEENKKFVLSKQLLRSGTSVGAMVREAEHAESKAP